MCWHMNRPKEPVPKREERGEVPVVVFLAFGVVDAVIARVGQEHAAWSEVDTRVRVNE